MTVIDGFDDYYQTDDYRIIDRMGEEEPLPWENDEEAKCPNCKGKGVINGVSCYKCGGSGKRCPFVIDRKCYKVKK